MNVYIRETVRVMAAWGVGVDVFSREHDAAGDDRFDWGPGCRLIHVPTGPVAATKAELPRWLDRFVAGVLERTRGDGPSYGGIVSHYWLSGLAALRLREHWHAPHVAGFHTLALAKPRAFGGERSGSRREIGEREVIAGADALLAATEHDRAALVTDYAAAPDRIRMAPPGVDTRRFRPLARNVCCRRLGLEDAGQRVLFVGRTVPLKGIPVLLEALSRLPADVKAIIVGGSRGDAEHQALVDTAEHLGVGDRVRFEASVPHERLPLYFGASDVCVVPSYYESFGMVALEALACGRAVIAARVGGLAAVVDHGVNGLLVTPGSSDELTEALATLLGDARLREALGRAGVARARYCSWQRTAESILGALAEPDASTSEATRFVSAAAG